MHKIAVFFDLFFAPYFDVLKIFQKIIWQQLSMGALIAGFE